MSTNLTPKKPLLIQQDLYGQAEAAYAQNDLAATKRLCQLILTGKPNDVRATILLGITFARQGKAPFAISYLKNALRWVPNSFEAHSALSTVLCRTGKAEEGLEHGRKAIESNPNEPDGYINLGLNLKSLRRFHEAADAFAMALQLAPTHLGAAQNLAAALQDARRDKEAKAAWEAVISVDPKNASGWFSLGQLHLMLGEFDEAIDCARELVGFQPQSSKAHLLLALALSEAGKGQEAEKHLRTAIGLDPNEGLALAALGFWLQEQGDFTGSEAALNQALKILPTHGFAHYNLYRCKKASAQDSAQLDSMRDLALSENLHPRDRSYLNYALGKAHEDLVDYEKAIGYFDAANELAYSVWLAHKPWDPNAYSEAATDTMRFFDRSRLQQAAMRGNPSKLPIFIVGMMRSGTSLMEQILSAHPEVGGGGELSFWHEKADAVFGLSKDRLNESDLRHATAEYMNKLRSFSPDKKHVTDKLPHNYALLGLIHSALPKAKIVHVTRNPIDNCLSIYTTAYQRPPVFAHKRENIVLAYREYQRYMHHWTEVLPTESIIEVAYEDLIRSPETVTRRVIDFCGLEWSDSCLHHEENQRSVRTPSLWQVRQPLYSTSIERWKRFETWIAPFDELNSLI